MLASVLTYSQGRTLKKPISENVFMPDYLGERKPTANTDKSLEEQAAEFKAFHGKLKSMIGKK